MTLDQFRTFEKAAILRSFTRAAEHLGLAQPSVSRIIGELETEWKCELFHRTGRGVELTEHGEEALKRVQALLRSVENLSGDMQSLGKLPGGNVVIALPPSLIPSLLPSLVQRLREERPAIRLRVYEGFSEQVIRWLGDGTAHIALYSEYHLEGQGRDLPQTDSFVLADSRVVMTGAGERIPSAAGIDFAEISKYPLVLPAPTNGLRLLVESVARNLSVRLNIVAEADSVLAQEALATELGGYILRGEGSLLRKGPGERFRGVAINNPSIQRRIVLSTGPQSHLSRAARDVASFITAVLRANNAGHVG